MTMKTEKNNIEFVDTQVEREEMSGFSLKGVIDGSVLTVNLFIRHLAFILFLVLLAVIYIANRYNAENITRSIDALKEEVKNYQTEHLTTASELLNKRRRSEVKKMIYEKELGLEEPEKPPYKIKSE